MAYKSIDSYGVIGDLHTAVLVGIDGSIDWACFPNFDSPSVFGAILDERKGGHFRICGTREGKHKQMYWPDTNVLITRFLNAEGVGEVVDFLVIGETGRPWRELVRMVRCVRGTVPFKMECLPKFDYARAEHRTILEQGRAQFTAEVNGAEARMELFSSLPLQAEGGDGVACGVACDFQLKEGECAVFVPGSARTCGGMLTRT
jgi:GH15 family glucan-1,4-alpha-glucosidase